MKCSRSAVRTSSVRRTSCGRYARLRELRRWLLPVPLLTPHLSGLWLALVTPAQARVGRALVEGLKNPTVVRSSAAFDAFRIEPTPLRMALAKAIEDGARLRQKVDTRTTVLDASPSQVFAPIRQIGGTNGWYFGNSLWRARGWLDLGFGGEGTGRGRRDPETCGLIDVIDHGSRLKTDRARGTQRFEEPVHRTTDPKHSPGGRELRHPMAGANGRSPADQAIAKHLGAH